MDIQALVPKATIQFGHGVSRRSDWLAPAPPTWRHLLVPLLALGTVAFGAFTQMLITGEPLRF